MHVLMLNGSCHPKGCTYTALDTIAKQLAKHEITSDIVQIGTKPINDCIACGKCVKTGYCVFDTDGVNKFIDQLKAADGVIIGSPTYYAGPTGAVCSFLNRVFFRKGEPYMFKPAAAIMSCRRGGSSASFDRLNKYFTINRMPVVSSQYWNSVHGNTPEEVLQDVEGLQIMRTLADNMAWLIKCIACGKEAGINPPTPEEWTPTNFIR